MLKEEQKLPVDVCGSKTSVLKLSNLEFAMNLAISFRSCQSNREQEFHAELRWEVIKFIAREVCTHSVKLSGFFLICCGHVD